MQVINSPKATYSFTEPAPGGLLAVPGMYKHDNANKVLIGLL